MFTHVFYRIYRTFHLHVLRRCVFSTITIMSNARLEEKQYASNSELILYPRQLLTTVKRFRLSPVVTKLPGANILHSLLVYSSVSLIHSFTKFTALKIEIYPPTRYPNFTDASHSSMSEVFASPSVSTSSKCTIKLYTVLFQISLPNQRQSRYLTSFVTCHLQLAAEHPT